MSTVKKIVTHTNPDLDAVVCLWLVKRFLPGWEKAEVKFAMADKSVSANQGRDNNPDELWVDIGRGKLDHHQTPAYLSATRLTWEYIQEQRQGQPPGELETEAVEAMVEVVTQVDNAKDLFWPEVTEGRYSFYLHNLIDGLRGGAETDEQVVEFSLRALDAALWRFKNRIKAESELAAGREFETPWGGAIAVETGNKQVLWQGEAKGYVLVVKKDPEKGGVQVYARPDSTVDLTKTYNRVQEVDPDSDWFLHSSKRLLLNQSSLNPGMRPTKLSLKKIMEILKEN